MTRPSVRPRETPPTASGLRTRRANHPNRVTAAHQAASDPLARPDLETRRSAAAAGPLRQPAVRRRQGGARRRRRTGPRAGRHRGRPGTRSAPRVADRGCGGRRGRRARGRGRRRVSERRRGGRPRARPGLRVRPGRDPRPLRARPRRGPARPGGRPRRVHRRPRGPHRPRGGERPHLPEQRVGRDLRRRGPGGGLPRREDPHPPGDRARAARSDRGGPRAARRRRPRPRAPRPGSPPRLERPLRPRAPGGAGCAPVARKRPARDHPPRRARRRRASSRPVVDGAEPRVQAIGPVHAGIDGEAAELTPPLAFAIRPAALRVRIPARDAAASPPRRPGLALARHTSAPRRR